MREPITAEQLQAAKKSSEPAVAAIIARYMPVIRRYARRAVQPGLELEDAVQEGIIGLFNAIQTYRDNQGASFNTYAQVCIQNAIFTARRAAGRKKHAPLNQSIPIPAGQSIPGPEEDAIASEQVSLTLQKARTHLSALEQQVLALFLDGLTYEEIAEKLGKSTKTVDNALARVRRKLRQ